MENGDRTAYPLHPEHDSKYNAWEGLTKREHFAAMAMQGFLSNAPDWTESNGCLDYVSRASVAYADALLAELEKPRQ